MLTQPRVAQERPRRRHAGAVERERTPISLRPVTASFAFPQPHRRIARASGARDELAAWGPRRARLAGGETP